MSIDHTLVVEETIIDGAVDVFSFSRFLFRDYSDEVRGRGASHPVQQRHRMVLLGAMRLGRPVKWLEDRREHMIAANQSRQQRHVIRATVDAEGHLLGPSALQRPYSTGARPDAHRSLAPQLSPNRPTQFDQRG